MKELLTSKWAVLLGFIVAVEIVCDMLLKTGSSSAYSISLAFLSGVLIERYYVSKIRGGQDE